MSGSAKRAAPKRIGVFLVDDHGVVRMGSRSLIDAQDDMEVVGEASTAAECLESLDHRTADVVVLDVRLPDMNGADLCREIKSKVPELKMVMLTAFADETALAASFLAGASAFVLKNVRGNDLLSAIRCAHAGERFVDETTAERIESHVTGHAGDLMKKLSPQEAGVAHFLALGMTNREIAEQMGLAEKTVKNYVSNLLSKLGMSRRSQAAAYVAHGEALASGVVESESWDELEDALSQ